jgi:hypothetical protein
MLNRSLVRDVETVVSGDDLVGRSGDSLDDALMDEPIILFPEADGAELRGKRYSIFQVPISDEGVRTYCFKIIGRGATFCTAQDCTINHKGAGTVMTVSAGDVFVSKKTAGSAFVEPMVAGHLIHHSVVDEWKLKQLPLENWTAKFVVATASATEGPASAATLEAQEDFFNAKATAYKTPAKRKHLEFEEQPFFIKASPYSPQANDEEKGFALQDLGEVIGFLGHMDEGLSHSSLTLHSLIDDYRVVKAKNDDHLNALWMRMETLASFLGTRPPTLGAEFETPSVWAAVGQVASMLEKVFRKIEAIKPDLLVAQAKTALETMFVDRLSLLRDEFDTTFGSFRTTLITVSRALGDRVGNLEVLTAGYPLTGPLQNNQDDLDRPGKKARISEDIKINQRLERLESLGDTSRPGEANVQMMKVGEEKAIDIVTRFETRMNDMETQLGRVMAKGDERAIGFAGLGFLKPAQANSWIESEMPHHPTGAIVDIHIVFERVHHSMSNVSTLSVMQQLVKIKVQSIADGSAITSFDQRIPKFFSKSSGHRVIKDAASFLDLVPAWGDWDDAQTGYRLQLEEELIAFEQAHSEEIEGLQEYSPKAYTVAKLALTASVAWIHGFISFIDTYYRELNKAKFGSGKAWHVTTRLAKRMLDDIASARQSVHGSFIAGDPTQVCQKVIWGVLKAHDVMADFKKHGYKHHPAIASELVKFLAVNTSFELLEKMTAKVSVLESDVSELKKVAAGAVKAASTAGNSADALKLVTAGLAKRLTTLESKK